LLRPPLEPQGTKEGVGKGSRNV